MPNEQLAADVRFALRGFRRAPSFVATVVLTIALALGLNTTAFTIFDTYVLRPIAVRDPWSLYALTWLDRDGHDHGFAWRDYEQARALPGVAASFAFSMFVARADGRPLIGVAASGNALQVLGATTALGRSLVAEDATPPTGAPVMVLSYDAWRGRFGADSTIIGRKVLVHGRPFTVVGVLARGFGGISAVPPDVWVPITSASALTGAPDPFTPTAPRSLRLVLRLRPGVTADGVRVAIGPWTTRVTRDERDSLRAVGAELTSIASALPRDRATIEMFAPVLTAFALVLLIACANVMNVMLARAIARQREIGIRLALGAGRGRLVRQLLTESVLLSLPAAALGFALSRWTVGAGVRLMFASLPPEFAPYVRVVPLEPDLRVFAFLLVAAVGSALLFGLVPAIQATRPRIVHAARGQFDGDQTPGRLRHALVAGQVAACALLLIVTGVLLRGAERARGAVTGLQPAHVVQIETADELRTAALDRLRTDPGVLGVATSTAAPLDGSFPTTPVRAGDGQRVEQAAYDFVSSGYFSVVGVPLARGRAFGDADERSDAAVAIVSESAARRLWPGRDAIGQTVQLAAEQPAGSALARVRTAQVVGVARDAVSGWIGTGTERTVVYYPARPDARGLHVLARVDGEAARARDRLDRELAALDPATVREIHTLDDHLSMQRYPFRAFASVSSGVGIIALLLTVIGVYGVLSYVVAQRTREIGVRMALGAAMTDVVGSVVGQSMRLAAIGVGVGAVLAVALSRLFATVLVIVDTFDVAGYLLGIAIVLASCAAAAVAPSRRAARVNPIVALKSD